MYNFTHHKHLHAMSSFTSNDDLNAYVHELATASNQFYMDYKGRVASLNDDELSTAMDRYVSIQDGINAPIHFALILQNIDPITGTQTAGQIHQVVSQVTKPIVVFINELTKLGPARLDKILSDDRFSEARPMIRRLLVPACGPQPYFENDIAQRLMAQCNVGSDYDDKYTRSFREILQDEILYSKAYGYASSYGYRLAKSFVSEEEIHALRGALHNHKPDFQRVAKELLQLNAVGISPDADFVQKNLFDSASASKFMVGAYGQFSASLGGLADFAFSNGLVHFLPPGSQGASTIMACRCFLPEVFLGFDGSLADTRELAHELGHFMQAKLRNDNGHLQSMCTPFVDETCATFGERIFWESLLNRYESPSLKLVDIFDQFTTLKRFAVIDDFQCGAIDMCLNGKLNTSSLDKLWGDLNTSYTGLPEEHSNMSGSWRYVGQVREMPFAAISYGYSQLVSTQLWQAYTTAPDKFPDQYISFLRRGASAPAHELLGSFGFDTKSPTFWDAAIKSVFHGFDTAVSRIVNARVAARKDPAAGQAPK